MNGRLSLQEFDSDRSVQETQEDTMDQLIKMYTCVRCSVPYDWRKSTSSSLKMTYCSSLCEQGDLGFTIEAVIREHLIQRTSWRKLLAA